MRITKYILFFIVIGIAAYQFYPKPLCTPLNREIAITIDDLPIGKPDLEQIVKTLKKHHVPAFGFVIASWLDGQGADDLKEFTDAGFLIGSHSDTHPSLRKVNAQTYIADLDKADKRLSPMIQGTKYFRYPYLAQGTWSKKQKVLEYLSAHHYVIAPVTIDSKDFLFNRELITSDPKNSDRMKLLKQRYLDHVWDTTRKMEQNQHCSGKKQILLMHAKTLNAYFLDDVLSMLEVHGYRFISLQEAMREDPGVAPDPLPLS